MLKIYVANQNAILNKMFLETVNKTIIAISIGIGWKETLYLMMHSTHFSYGYMVLDIS